MTTTPHHSEQPEIDSLHPTTPTRLVYQANVVVRSFILDRAAGGVAIYNSPGLGPAVRRDPGHKTTRLLINHGHEAMYGKPDIDVDTYVHEQDRDEVARSMPVAGVFSERVMIDDDLEVIPTPGHTAGTTSYLWDNGDHRYLFTGDFIWIEHGEWRAVVLDRKLRADYLNSLDLVRELDFDVLVPWGVTDDCRPFALTHPDDTRRRIDAISTRVERGLNR